MDVDNQITISDNQDQIRVLKKYTDKELLYLKFVLFMVGLISSSVGLVIIALFIILQMFGLSPGATSLAETVFGLPNIIQPVFGYIIDQYPIFRQRRKSYIIIFSFISGVFSILLGIFIDDMYCFVIFNTILQTTVAVYMVAGQALLVDVIFVLNYHEKSEKIKSKNATQLNTINSMGSFVGFFATGYLGSWLIGPPVNLECAVLFYIYGVCQFVLTGTAIFMPNDNWVLPKKAEQNEQIALLETEDSSQNTQQLQGIHKNTAGSSCYNIKKCFQFVKVQLFLQIVLFTQALAPEYTYALMSYYRNELGMTTAFLGVDLLLSGLSGMIGAGIYFLCFKNFSAKSMLIAFNFLNALFNLTIIILLNRWNIAWGIPDAVFIIAWLTLQGIIMTIGGLPITIVLSRLCPYGLEGLFQTLLAGFQSIGGAIGGSFAAFMISDLGITNTNYDNLWIAAVIYTLWCIITTIPLFFVDFESPIIEVEKLNKIEKKRFDKLKSSKKL